MEVQSALLVPDVHVPFHDLNAWKVLLKVAKSRKWSHVIQLGDFGDYYSMSRHLKSPARRAIMLHDEVAAITEAYAELMQATPGAEHIAIFGNHEFRFERYLAHNAPELFESIRLHKILGLEDAGWKWVQYKKFYKLGRVIFTHNVKEKAGPYAHRHALTTAHANIVIGHTHRMAIQYEGSLEGPHVGAMLGWLGSSEAAEEYVDDLSLQIDPVLGFGIMYHWDNKKRFRLDAVPIVKNECCVPERPILFAS